MPLSAAIQMPQVVEPIDPVPAGSSSTQSRAPSLPDSAGDTAEQLAREDAVAQLTLMRKMQACALGTAGVALAAGGLTTGALVCAGVNGAGPLGAASVGLYSGGECTLPGYLSCVLALPLSVAGGLAGGTMLVGMATARVCPDPSPLGAPAEQEMARSPGADRPAERETVLVHNPDGDLQVGVC